MHRTRSGAAVQYHGFPILSDFSNKEQVPPRFATMQSSHGPFHARAGLADLPVPTKPQMDQDERIACPECDVLHRKVTLPRMTAARCSRCNAVLYRCGTGNVDRVLALTLAALITLLIANAYPIVELRSNGLTSEATLLSAVEQLWNEQNMIVAGLVLCSTLLFPLTELLALLWLFIPIRAGWRPAGFAVVLRTIIALRPWGMIEVFMLGVLVTLVKLSGLARVIPDVALFAFGMLTVLLAAVIAFDLRSLWDMADALPSSRSRPLDSLDPLTRHASNGATPAHPLPAGHGNPPL